MHDNARHGLSSTVPAFTGGSDVGGIFKTTNGGGTWKKLTNGLPGQTGRIGLAICASKPKVVMAVLQSDEGGAIDIRDHSQPAAVYFVRKMAEKNGRA